MKISVRVENLSDPEGSGKTSVQEFEQAEVTLGRSKTNQLVLAASDVSNRHARLFVEFSSESGIPVLFIVDTGSSNGTFIEDLRLIPNDPYELHEGQRLVLGSFLLSPELSFDPAELPVHPLPEPLESDDSPANEAPEMPYEQPEQLAAKEPEPPLARLQDQASESKVKKEEAPAVEPASDAFELAMIAAAEADSAGTSAAHSALELQAQLLFAGTALQFMCDRISHALRTPLGVAMNTVADARASGALDEATIADGEQAHQTILAKLHFLKFFSQPFVAALEQSEISEVLFSELSAKPLLRKLNIELTVENASAVGDGALLARAIEGIVRYLAARWPNQPEPIRISIVVCPVDQNVQIEVRAAGQGIAAQQINGTASFVDVAHGEQLLEASALLFADLVARLHNGATKCSADGPNTCVFEILLPVGN